jgi:hypothetical protein
LINERIVVEKDGGSGEDKKGDETGTGTDKREKQMMVKVDVQLIDISTSSSHPPWQYDLEIPM